MIALWILARPQIRYVFIMVNVQKLKINNPCRNVDSNQNLVYLTKYFDGVAKQGWCGFGAILLLNLDHHVHLFWFGGEGSNTRAKVIPLWGLLFFAKTMNLEQMIIIGYAKVIIYWSNGMENISAPNLTNWMFHIENLRKSFTSISFRHVYRELNGVATLFPKGELMRCCCLSITMLFAMAII